MPCYDCNDYPLCINYPDGTWKTVYNEQQEEVARSYKSAKDIGSNINKQPDVEKVEAETDAKIIEAQQKWINSKPQDANVRPRFGSQIKKPCKNC